MCCSATMLCYENLVQSVISETAHKLEEKMFPIGKVFVIKLHKKVPCQLSFDFPG